MQDNDWAIRQLGLDPYQVVSLKELIIRALSRFPGGASVGELRLQFCSWGRDIERRRLTKRLSSLRSAGILCRRGRAWSL
jgi:hypothetical protein